MQAEWAPGILFPGSYPGRARATVKERRASQDRYFEEEAYAKDFRIRPCGPVVALGSGAGAGAGEPSGKPARDSAGWADAGPGSCAGGGAEQERGCQEGKGRPGSG